ncbi:MAG: hypothetical protein IJD51_01175 [Clostridia bacterium]|nr:hypothetical protein [Clostridia bacterium]
MKARTKKRLLITAIVLLSVALVYLVIFLFPRPKNYEGENPFIKADSDLPVLIAHRGGDGEFPGNTLEAYYNAYSVDKNFILETDVNLTSDGVLILCHDTTLDGTTNVDGEIIDWSYADLISRRVNFGYDNDDDEPKELYKNEAGEVVYPSSLAGYPTGLDGRDSEIFLATTFEELVTSFPTNKIIVEIKQDGEVGFDALHEAVRIAEEYDAFDRIIFASFHDEIFEESMRMLGDGEVPESFMASPSLGSTIKFFVMHLLGVDVFYFDNIAALQVPTEEYGFTLATKGFMKTAHKHNLAVQFWTINDKEQMRHLIEIGADGIMTDYPHRLAEVYSSYAE